MFEVQDSVMPANSGRYELEVSTGDAQCFATSAEADIELSVQTLGAVYLGAHRFTELMRAGLIQGDPGALATADRMFSWDRQPWCPAVF